MSNYELPSSQTKHNQCWHCTDRVVGCHSSCEKYAEMVADNKRFNDAMRVEKLVGYHPYGKTLKNSYFIPRRKSYENG